MKVLELIKAGYPFALEVSGDKEICATLERLGRRTQSQLPVFSGKVIPYLRQIHSSRFETKVTPEGVPWQPLSVAYLKSPKKSTAAYPKPEHILKRTGEMWMSLLRNTAHTVLEVDEHTLVYGTGNFPEDRHFISQYGARVVPKSAFGPARLLKHGEATRSKHVIGRVPARPFLGINDSNKATICSMIMRYIEGAFARE